MFPTRWLRVTKNEKQPECPTPGDWLNTTQCTHIGGYDAAIKMML